MGVVVTQSIKGTLVHYIGALIGFFTTFVVLTKYLTPEEVGLTRVMIDAAMMCSGLAQLGTSSSAMRFYPYFKDQDSRDHGFFGWSLLVPCMGFVIFVAVFFLFENAFVQFFSEKSILFVDYLYFLVPMSFFMLYMAVFETNSNLLMRIAVPKFIREVGVRILTLIDYVLYGCDIISLDQMVLFLCLIYGLATIMNVIYLLSLKRISFRIDLSFVTPALRKDFLFYTLFCFAAAVSGTVAPYISQLLVSGTMGLAWAGVYAIALAISSIIEIPYRSLGAISRPHVSEAMSNNDIAKANFLCKNVALHQLLVGSFLFFAIWVNIDLLFELLPNGEDYVAGKWVVFILGLSKLLNSVLNIGTTVLSYSKYYYMSLGFTLLLTFLVIFLNVKLIPVIGIEGSALSTLSSYLVYYLLLLWVVNRKTKVNPFSKKELLVLAIVLVMFAVNTLWCSFVTPMLESWCSNMLLAHLLDGVVRTILLLSAGALTVYKLKVSEQVNEIADSFISRFRR